MKIMEHSNRDKLARFPCPVPLEQLPVYEHRYLNDRTAVAIDER